jgi:hypothetical protein
MLVFTGLLLVVLLVLMVLMFRTSRTEHDDSTANIIGALKGKEWILTAFHSRVNN